MHVFFFLFGKPTSVYTYVNFTVHCYLFVQLADDDITQLLVTREDGNKMVIIIIIISCFSTLGFWLCLFLFLASVCLCVFFV